MYVLIDFVMNLRNEDLHWFFGKKTFIDSGVYMCFSWGVCSELLLLFSCDCASFGAGE